MFGESNECIHYQFPELQKLQTQIMQRVEAGKIITGSGGIRKLRWARQGMGKSGGVRVISYWAKARDQIYMLTMYSKPCFADSWECGKNLA